MECHEKIISEMLSGMSFSDKDVLLWLDLHPNRFLALTGVILVVYCWGLDWVVRL